MLEIMYNEKIKIDKLRVFSFKLIKNSRIKPITNIIEIDFIIIFLILTMPFNEELFRCNAMTIVKIVL